MDLQWLAGPAACYVLLGAGLILTLVLFASVNAGLRSAEKRIRRRAEALEASLAELQARLEAMSAEVNNQTAIAALPPQPFCSSLNLSKRAQAVRMTRRGESPEQIAAALAVPLKEIELLLKIHSLVIARY